jgi:hypothetical protein
MVPPFGEALDDEPNMLPISHAKDISTLPNSISSSLTFRNALLNLLLCSHSSSTHSQWACLSHRLCHRRKPLKDIHSNGIRSLRKTLRTPSPPPNRNIAAATVDGAARSVLASGLAFPLLKSRDQCSSESESEEGDWD